MGWRESCSAKQGSQRCEGDVVMMQVWRKKEVTGRRNGWSKGSRVGGGRASQKVYEETGAK
jgi:hypothetical protein